jgi:hypothetical protein
VVSVLVLAATAGIAALCAGMVWYETMTPMQEVRPGWGHFLFSTCSMIGFVCVLGSIASLMGWNEIGSDPDWPWAWWVGLALAVIVVVAGSQEVSDEIEDIRTGIKSRPHKLRWRPALLPRVAMLIVLSGAAFFIGIQLGQFILADIQQTGLRLPKIWPHLIEALIVTEFTSIAVIGTWALCLKLWTLGAKPTGVAEAIGGVSLEVGATIGKLFAVVKGVLWCGFALLLVVISWPPSGLISWAVLIAGVIVFGKGLREIGTVLKATPTPDHPSVSEMNARTATEDEARRAARGESGNTVADSQIYRD